MQEEEGEDEGEDPEFKLPDPDDSTSILTAEDAPLLIAGWGDQRFDVSSPAPSLLEARVPSQSLSTCRSEFEDLGDRNQFQNGDPDPIENLEVIIKANMLCAGFEDIGKVDACRGDSGGPAWHEELGILLGVSSWGIGCARSDSPGIFARTACYVDWLDFALGGHEETVSDALRGYEKGTRTKRRAVLSAGGNDCLLEKRVETCACP